MTEKTPRKTDSAPTTSKFDFDQVVAQARRDFPEETAQTTFINGDDPDALDQLYQWAVSQRKRTIEWDNMEPYVDNKRPFSTDSRDGATVLMMHPSNPTQSFPGDPDKSNFLTFDHELGHIVAPKGMGKHIPADVTELVADSFAAIRGLQRGSLTKQDVQTMANHRDAGFLLYSGLSHLTSMSLDAIVINPKNIDIASLSPKEIGQVAKRHANAFENKRGSYNKFAPIEDLGKPTWEDDALPAEERVEQRLHAVTEIAMTARRSSMSFYLAARMIINAVEHGGVTYNGETVKLQGGDAHWQSVKNAVEKRAGKRDIGARKAAQNPALSQPQDNSIKARISRFIKPLGI